MGFGPSQVRWKGLHGPHGGETSVKPQLATLTCKEGYNRDASYPTSFVPTRSLPGS
jgi:hypothetical protein